MRLNQPKTHPKEHKEKKMFEIGMLVLIVGTGVVGTITAIRKGMTTGDVMGSTHCDNNPDTPLPDYVEIDGNVQVHPSKVKKV